MDRIFYNNEEFGKPSEMSLKKIVLEDQIEYDSLTQAQKNDPTKIYFISASSGGKSMSKLYYKDVPFYDGTVNPNYNWWSNADETIFVREDLSDPAHTTYRWYFKDFEFTDYQMAIPTELARFAPQQAGCCGWCEDWYDPDEHPEREPNCVVGFYGNTMRMWSIGLGSNMIGTCNMCIIESTDASISDQVYHGYIEPTFDPING